VNLSLNFHAYQTSILIIKNKVPELHSGAFRQKEKSVHAYMCGD
jgi:hypothetical protein